MAQAAMRLGVIYPVGGADQEYYQFAEALGDHVRVYLITTRLMGGDQDHRIEALMETARIDYLENAARRLASLSPDVAVWACTSASFIVGRDGAAAQASAIAAVTGCPASSTSIAFANALEAFGIKKVAVMATYPEDVARRFEAFLAAWQVEVCGLRWLDVISGWEAGTLEPQAVVEAVRAADKPEAQAILVPDTALPTLGLIDGLEAELGKPVLTANQVTLWEALRLAGVEARAQGWGRLLAA